MPAQPGTTLLSPPQHITTASCDRPFLLHDPRHVACKEDTFTHSAHLNEDLPPPQSRFLLLLTPALRARKWCGEVFVPLMPGEGLRRPWAGHSHGRPWVGGALYIAFPTVCNPFRRAPPPLRCWGHEAPLWAVWWGIPHPNLRPPDLRRWEAAGFRRRGECARVCQKFVQFFDISPPLGSPLWSNG